MNTNEAVEYVDRIFTDDEFRENEIKKRDKLIEYYHLIQTGLERENIILDMKKVCAPDQTEKVDFDKYETRTIAAALDYAKVGLSLKVCFKYAELFGEKGYEMFTEMHRDFHIKEIYKGEYA